MASFPMGFPVDALTLERIDAKGVDIVNSTSPFLTQVLAQSENFNGRQLNWHIVMAQNNTVQNYTGFDPLNVSPQYPLTQATIYHTNISATVSLADDQVAINATDAGKVDYVKSMSENAFNSLAVAVSNQLYGTGVVGKEFTGVGSAINNVTGDNLDVNGNTVVVTRPGIATYAGVSRSSFPGWNSTVRQAGGALTLNTVYKFQALVEKASLGVKPDTVFVGPTTWTYFAGLTTPTQRHEVNPNDKSPMLSIGARAVMVAGLTIISDVLCPEGLAYFIRKDGIKFASITPANATPISYSNSTVEDNGQFKNTVKSFWRSEILRPINQMASSYHVGLTGNFIVKKPSDHGCLTAITS